MSTQSYDLLKISWNLYDTHYTKLTKEQRDKVWEIYYDFY
jgi:hypothetical protein